MGDERGTRLSVTVICFRLDRIISKCCPVRFWERCLDEWPWMKRLVMDLPDWKGWVKLFAGSWNGIYRLNGKTREPEAFLSNRYTCYLHRFHVDEERIITALGFNDTIVIMDHEGQVQELLRVDASLRVERVKREEGLISVLLPSHGPGRPVFFTSTTFRSLVMKYGLRLGTSAPLSS